MSELLSRNLVPFRPLSIYYNVLNVADIEVTEDVFYRLGIKEKSKQANFLKSNNSNYYVVLISSTPKPTQLYDESIVAYALGSFMSGELMLWQVGIVKSHPWNDSERGKNWGVYGISKVREGNNVRWKSHDGKKLTMKNHAKYIKGTPNPYAVSAVFLFAKYFPNIRSITQNPESPCAAVFHKDYDHTTHPAIVTIYKALGFERSMVGNYVWYSDVMPTLDHSLKQMLVRMHKGIDVV
jgi:hypothetical protein